MMQQQRNDLLVGHGSAAAIHGADAVGIAVGDQTKVMWMAAELRAAQGIIFRQRFGAEAAEEHIVSAIERGDRAIRSGEQRFKHARADTEQRIVGDTQFGSGDQLEIHQALDGGKVCRTDVQQANGWRSAGLRHGSCPQRPVGFQPPRTAAEAGAPLDPENFRRAGIPPARWNRRNGT